MKNVGSGPPAGEQGQGIWNANGWPLSETQQAIVRPMFAC